MSINYDENHRVIEKTATTTFVRSDQHHNKNRVKFIDEQPEEQTTETSEAIDKMNSNLASSQPLVNGHLNNVQQQPVPLDLQEQSLQKLANSQPHVTISAAHHEIARENRAFGTKIDK